jgi:hypothetical protein
MGVLVGATAKVKVEEGQGTKAEKRNEVADVVKKREDEKERTGSNEGR